MNSYGLKVFDVSEWFGLMLDGWLNNIEIHTFRLLVFRKRHLIETNTLRKCLRSQVKSERGFGISWLFTGQDALFSFAGFLM